MRNKYNILGCLSSIGLSALKFSIFASALLPIVSCSDEYTGELQATNDPKYLNVDRSSLQFSPVAGQQDFTVQSVGLEWSVSNSAEWINASPLSGNASRSVSVSVSENTSYSDRGRAAVINVVGNGITRNVTVNQESPALLLDVSSKLIDMPGYASEASVNVRSNSEWSYSVANGGEWLRVSQNGEGLSLAASENATGASRTAVINISSGSKFENVNVTQRAADVELSTESIEFGCAQGSKAFTFSSEASWTAKTNYSWIDITPSSGSAGSNNSVMVSVTPNNSKNQRVGTFAIGNKEVTVTQEGVILSPSTQNITFVEAGETQTFRLESNTQWKLNCTYIGADKDWLQIDKTEGNGNTTVKLSAGYNNGTIRTAFLQFVNLDGSVASDQIVVSQNGTNATVINSLSKFSPEGATIDFDITELSNTSTWTATVTEGAEWIHVSPTTGKGSAPLAITVDQTDGFEDRNGKIQLDFANGARYIITVNQAGADIIVSPKQYHFFAKGGTSEAFTVLYNEGNTPKVRTTVSWLKATLNGNLMTLTADENLTGSARQTTVTFTVAGKQSTTVVTVTQASQHGDFSIEGYDADIDISYSQYEAVDLGLSVKWATCNVGASKPEEYGDYYAWGEIETKSFYTQYNYPDNPSHDYITYTKYAIDKQTVLDPEDDVAHVKWGGSWRMPTDAEQDELFTKCTWTWTTQNGVNGQMVTGPNGNSIFLPAAGCRYYSYLDVAGPRGYYWSSSLYSLYSLYSDSAYVLYFSSGNVNWGSCDRYYGLSVRPVCP